MRMTGLGLIPRYEVRYRVRAITAEQVHSWPCHDLESASRHHDDIAGFEGVTATRIHVVWVDEDEAQLPPGYNVDHVQGDSEDWYYITPGTLWRPESAFCADDEQTMKTRADAVRAAWAHYRSDYRSPR